MVRNVKGKFLISGLVVLLCAKAATSFPRTPSDVTAPELEIGQTELRVAEEEAAPVAQSEDFDEMRTVAEATAVSQCEAPEQILQSFNDERLFLETKRQDLADREAELALAREKLEIEKSALAELKSSIEGLLAKIENQKTEDLERLIALYQNMKPAEAATIMNDLDIEVMIMVLGAMQPRVAAPIMAKMSPVRARAVSKIILERSKLPGDQNLNGIRFN